jgi:hypothetical protein
MAFSIVWNGRMEVKITSDDDNTSITCNLRGGSIERSIFKGVKISGDQSARNGGGLFVHLSDEATGRFWNEEIFPNEEIKFILF